MRRILAETLLSLIAWAAGFGALWGCFAIYEHGRPVVALAFLWAALFVVDLIARRA